MRDDLAESLDRGEGVPHRGEVDAVQHHEAQQRAMGFELRVNRELSARLFAFVGVNTATRRAR